MTQPRSEATTLGTGAGGMRSRLPNAPAGGAFGGPPAKPQPAAPLTDEQMRVKCIELAIAAKVDSRFITEAAAKFHDYVKSGTPSSGAAAYGHGA